MFCPRFQKLAFAIGREHYAHRIWKSNMQNQNSIRNPEHNRLKLRTLEIFNLYGPLNPPAWAVLAKFLPIRASYSYLLRLHRFGLLNRTRDKSGLLLYSLSDRGWKRLQWLSIPNDPNPSLLKPEETTRDARIPNATQ
jgi:hypothetical protein